MEEGIQKGLVGIDQRVELGRYGKDHMEIGGVDDFRFPSVNPEFLEERLAVGAVAVAAGIIMEVISERKKQNTAKGGGRIKNLNM